MKREEGNSVGWFWKLVTLLCLAIAFASVANAQGNPAPTLSAINPTSGGTGGGTTVTLTGNNFVSGATVVFDTAAATSVSVVSATSITASTPAHVAGTVAVTVTNPDGQSATLSGVVQPLSNTGFESGAANWVQRGTGTFTVQTNSANAHSGNNYAELSVQSSSDHPVVYAATASNAPAYFPVNPGDVISFGGWGYHVSGDGKARWVLEVSDANKANASYISAAPYNVTTASWVNFSTSYTVPAGMANIRFYCEITGATGPAVDRFDDAFLQRNTPNGGFTYITSGNPAPTLSAINPTSGGTGGGTAVTLTGSNFISGATVAFDSTAATAVSVVSGTSITATTPAHAAGTAAVTVKNPDGQQTTQSVSYAYTQSNPAPTLTSLNPTSGGTGGGTAVTLTGSNFVSGATVAFDTAAATSVSVVSGSSITAMTPPHAAGTAAVTVKNPDGQQAQQSVSYTYTQGSPAPTLSSINPTSGGNGGGTTVTLTGTNFVSGATVAFDTAAATSVSFTSSTSITASTPAHVAGTVGVTVTNPDGQSATLSGAIQPLSNTGFESGAAGWAQRNTGTFTVQTNSANAHSGNNYAELSVQSSSDHPVVYAATAGNAPAYFPVNPGDVISFGGWGYHVSGDGKARWAIEVSDANKANASYIAAAPYGVTTATWVNFSSNYTVPAGMAYVRFYCEITGATGPAVDRFDDAFLQRNTPNGGFTYIAPQGPPTITSLSATQGADSGGDTISISGSNFASGAKVTFGGTAASATVINSTLISVVTPAMPGGSVDVQVTNPDGQSATVGSLLHNQGFESGLAYWSFSGSGTPVVGTTTPNAHVGTSYLELSAASGAHPEVFASTASGGAYYVPVNAGDVITFGGYAYRVSGSANARWGLEITDANKANATYVAAPPYSAFDPLWTQEQGTYTVPSGKSFVRLFAEIVGGSSATVARFDDAVLQNSSGTPSGFTFISSPMVTSVSPNWGIPAGGTTRTVYGTGFRAEATVSFGSAGASNVQVVSANAIEVSAPPQGLGTVSVFVDQGSQSGSLQNAYTYQAAPAPSSSMLGLKHIIYTFQENRSFDNYFSKMNEYRQMQGVNDNAVDERDPNAALPDIAGQPITPYHFQTECHENLQPSWNSQHYDYDGGNMDNFLKAGNALGTSTYDPNGTRAIGYYDWTDFPFYYDLAFQFATSDRWFSSVLGPTDANRMYTFAATSLGWTATPHPPSGGYPNYTIFDLLDQAGISWKYYYQFSSPIHINFWSVYQRDPGKFVPISNYYNDVKVESTFPAVVFIEEGGFDEHPKPNPGTNGATESVQQGASTIRGFVNALMQSPATWQASAFILGYDEGGGLHDHVVPARLLQPDGMPPNVKIGTDASGLFNQSGLRVPITVISPWTKPHFVSHVVRDHTAILKLIETRFSLPPLTSRDDASDDMTEFFNFTVPTYMTPPPLVAQPTTGACDLSVEKAPGQ